MKKNVRIIALVMALMLLASSAALADADKITFAYMTQNNIPQQQELLRIQNLVNEWTVPNINTEVTLALFSNSDYITQVTLMLASGEQVDLFRSYNTPNIRFIKDGTALDITDYLDTYLADASAVLYPGFLKSSTHEGRVYGIDGMGSYYYPKGWTYRTDIIDELGIDLSNVKNVFDLTDIFAQVKEAYPNMILVDSTRADGIFEAWVSNDCQIDGLGEGTMANISGAARMNDTKIVNVYETEEFRQAALLTREWYEKGYFSKDAATSTATAAELLMSGNCLSIFVGLGNPTMAQTYTANYGYPFESIKISTHLTQSGMSGAWMINSMSQAPEAAAKFLNLLYTNEYIDNLLVYGEEGVDYQFNDEHFVIPPEGYAALNDVPYTANLNFYFWGDKWITYRVVGGLSDEMQEKTMKLNYEAQLSPYYGFLFDYSDYEAEYTACKNIVNEYKKAFWVGSLDVDSALAEMNGKLYASGLQTLLDAKQEQFDAWLSYQE